MPAKMTITSVMIDLAEKIVNRGNTAELKPTKDGVIVLEVKRDKLHPAKHNRAEMHVKSPDTTERTANTN